MDENIYKSLEARKSRCMNQLKQGDLGYRRKRNIEIEWVKNIQVEKEENVLGINWDNDKEIVGEEAAEDMSVVEVNGEENSDDMMTVNEIRIGNKLIDVKKLQSKVKAQDSQKITIYLDGSVINALKKLKKNKIIDSYSKCIQDALIQYLTE